MADLSLLYEYVRKRKRVPGMLGRLRRPGMGRNARGVIYHGNRPGGRGQQLENDLKNTLCVTRLTPGFVRHPRSFGLWDWGGAKNTAPPQSPHHLVCCRAGFGIPDAFRIRLVGG